MRGSAAGAALPALALVCLAAIVVVAAGGRTPSGTDASRPVPDVLLDSIISVGLVLLVPAAAITIYGLMQRKAIAAEIERRRYPRFGLAAWATFTLLLALLTWYRGRDWQQPTVDDELDEQAFPGGAGGPTTGPTDATATYEPELAWIPVVVVCLLGALAIAAFLVSTRRSAVAHADEPLTTAVAEILDDTLDDLRAEADPRRAVIAAFARLERALAANGLPRSRSETAQEYVRRALATLDVREGPAARLASLFEVAKFSDHAVDAGMKEEAIDALQDVRDDLRRAVQEREPELSGEASVA